jgi:hypothetical protein
MRPNTTVCPGSAKILKKMAKKEGKTPGGGGGGMGGGGGGGVTPRHERLLRQGKQDETRRKEAGKKEEAAATHVPELAPHSKNIHRSEKVEDRLFKMVRFLCVYDLRNGCCSGV